MTLGRHINQFQAKENYPDQLPVDVSKCKSRIMYIEDKSNGLEGAARIGRVFSLNLAKRYYKNRIFQSLKGCGRGKLL